MMLKANLKLWLKRLAIGVGVAVCIGAAGVGYFYMQCTAVIRSSTSQTVKTSAAQEAARKLALFQDKNRKGFVRLSEAEINAYLDDLIARSELQPATDGTNTTMSLVRSRAYLLPDGLVWNCWIKRKVGPTVRELAWQRLFRLVRADDRWDAQLSMMIIGRQRVWPWAWPWATSFLGNIDRPFRDKFGWLATAPALELKTNDLSLRLELWLYNYPDSNVLNRAKQ
jgi:hypothetical protein